jgi:hypothetical protein
VGRFRCLPLRRGPAHWTWEMEWWALVGTCWCHRLRISIATTQEADRG